MKLEIYIEKLNYLRIYNIEYAINITKTELT